MLRPLLSLVALLFVAGRVDAAPPRAGLAAASADTIEVARYATLAQAIAATRTAGTVLSVEDASTDFLFGTSVSLSGNRALVGDPLNDNAGGAYAGSAYVFAFDASQPDGQQWSLEAKLTASDGASFDQFGAAVSLSESRALIGAPADDDGGSASGSAYVFVFDGAQPAGQQWSQEAKLRATDAAPGDEFGRSVSLSEDRALVGAPEDDDNGSASGSAYVFGFDGAQLWGQETKLSAGDGNDRFGTSVALAGDRALIGASGASEAAGAAYVFGFDGTSWSQQAELTASDATSDDRFGFSVSLSGDRVLIGAPLSGGASDTGSAYVFAFDGAQPAGRRWTQEAKLTADVPRPNDAFGHSVSLDGGRALIGAPYSDGALFGKAFLFALGGGTWSQDATFVAEGGPLSGNRFGRSVSLSDDRALVGAPGDGDFFSQAKDPDVAYVIELGPGSAPPVADAGSDQTVVAGQTVALDGSASVGAVTFAWTLSGGAPLSGAGTATPTFCAAAPGVYTATLVVSGGGGSDADAVTVTAVAATAALSALVADVAATPGPDRDQKRALVAELKKAQRALARGVDPAPFLDAFRAQVLGFQAQGVLTAAAAGALVAAVDAVAEAVASPCSEAADAPAVASAMAEAGFGLSAWPNPSAGRATVAFSVETAGAVRLSVVDALGREVAVLVEGVVEAGRHEAVLSAGALPAGVYLVRLATADGQAATARLTRLR